MDYVTNGYRCRKFGDSYFVTTDHGSYCILSEDELTRLRQGSLDSNLRAKLEEKQVILTVGNTPEALHLMRERNSFLFSGASLHIVVVTLRCTMNCIYCQASSKPTNRKEFDMNKATARRTVDLILQSPARHLTIEFQGGEPLLNWEVVRYIVEYAERKGRKAQKVISFSLVTNLSEMDKEKMNFLIGHSVGICASLDGPKKLHDYNRRLVGASNFEQVVKWIKRFSYEYGKRHVTNRRVNALVTLTRKSLRYPNEIVDTYVSLGLNTIHLRFVNKLGVAEQVWSTINYSPRQYLLFWQKAVMRVEAWRRQGKDISERMVSLMFNKISGESDPNYLDLRSPCGAAIGQLAYHYNGDIYTCDEARMVGEDLFLLGNVKRDRYEDLVTCDRACAVINASINDQYVCNDCVYKPYCGICPVCNYVEYGTVIGRIAQSDRCRIFKAQFDWVVKQKFINNKNRS
jgi:uncharacterized protein